MTERTIKPKIPATLGEFLGECLDDLEKIEQTPGYAIDMHNWHQYFNWNDECRVCLGGCKLAGWGVPRESSVFPEEVMSPAGCLRAIDACQRGLWSNALSDFYGNADISRFNRIENEIDSPMEAGMAHAYSVNPIKFKQEMRIAASIFRKHGV